MRLIYGDLFKPSTYTDSNGNPLKIDPSAIVITTNGFVKSTGDGVMGRGCAQEAATRWPKLPLELGIATRQNGVRTMVIARHEEITIVSFPVKPAVGKALEDMSNVVGHMRNKFKPGSSVPGWALVADLHLIKTSAEQLARIVEANNWQYVVMPRPGCGAGELDWEEVRAVIEPCLPGDTYNIITWRKFGGNS